MGHRRLRLSTMIVSIADVLDALRCRPDRDGLATRPNRAIMGEGDRPAFNQVLPRRFIDLAGKSPVGTIVRLDTVETGVVTAEHPEDPFHPHVADPFHSKVKVLAGVRGNRIEEPFLANTRERDARGIPPARSWSR